MPLLDYFTTPSKRFFIGYLLSAGVIALLYCWLTHKKITLRATKEYWLHPSALLDYAYFIVSGLIKIYLIVPLVISAKSVMLWVNHVCLTTFGAIYLPMVSRATVAILYTVTLFIVSDFSRYWLHRAMHSIPFLWTFHKVHHSAEVLNPFTFYRVHPVENLLFGFRYSLVVGGVTGVFIYLFGAKVQLYDILGANAFLFIFNFIGGNLRHSHIELAYPPILEKLFISPRQHQLHHSYHFYRFNFGGYLAIWDTIFGTLRTTVTAHPTTYGLGEKLNARYRRLPALLLQPFTEAMKMMKNQFSYWGVLAITLVVGTVIFTTGSNASQTHAKATVEDKAVTEKKTDNETTDEADKKLQQAKATLGSTLFFDMNLSKNRTMSCATCHNPETGFVDQRGNGVDSMASLGDDGHSIGDRNAPTAGYAKFSPHFQANKGKNKKQSAFVGGQFLDGREPTLAGQAGGPPLNPIEMGMPDKASVIERIKENPGYISQFKTLFGEDVFDNTDKAYAAMTDSIQAFEETELFAPFDSKYDRFLRGEYDLTILEDLGRSLFFSNNNTNCSTCHKLHREDDPRETFTNFEYRNIGVPENKFLRSKNGVTAKDLGLYQNPLAQQEENKGKFKVSSLRNIAVTGPYMHNGVFKDLRTVVEFYDKYNNPKRKINPETGKPWGSPEVSENIALEELKAKVLTERKIDALVAFMKTLTDKRYEHLLEKQTKSDKK